MELKVEPVGTHRPQRLSFNLKFRTLAAFSHPELLLYLLHFALSSVSSPIRDWLWDQLPYPLVSTEESMSVGRGSFEEGVSEVAECQEQDTESRSHPTLLWCSCQEGPCPPPSLEVQGAQPPA